MSIFGATLVQEGGRAPSEPLKPDHRAALRLLAKALRSPPAGLQLVRHGNKNVPQVTEIICAVFRAATGEGAFRNASDEMGRTDTVFVHREAAEPRYLGVPDTVADYFGLARPATAGYCQGLNLWWVFQVWDRRGGNCAVVADAVDALVETLNG